MTDAPGARPTASEGRLLPGPLRDPHFRVAEDDRNRFEIVQAERVAVFPRPVLAFVRTGDRHVVERAFLPLVLPNARGNAAAGEFLNRLRFKLLIVRCHGLLSFD